MLKKTSIFSNDHLWPIDLWPRKNWSQQRKPPRPQAENSGEARKSPWTHKNMTRREGGSRWLGCFNFRVCHWQVTVVTFFFWGIFLINCQQSIMCDNRFLFVWVIWNDVYIYICIHVFLRLQFWISQPRVVFFVSCRWWATKVPSPALRCCERTSSACSILFDSIHCHLWLKVVPFSLEINTDIWYAF